MTTQSRSISIRLALSCKLQLGGSLPFGGSTSPAIARVARGRRSAYCVGNVWPAKPTQSIGHADLMTRWAAKISRQPQEFSEREKMNWTDESPPCFFVQLFFAWEFLMGCVCVDKTRRIRVSFVFSFETSEEQSTNTFHSDIPTFPNKTKIL